MSDLIDSYHHFGEQFKNKPMASGVQHYVTGGLGSLAGPAAGWPGGGLNQPGQPRAWLPPSDGLQGGQLPVARPWALRRLPTPPQGSHDKQRLPP